MPYPGSIPILDTVVDGTDYPSAAHDNRRNRVVEAIAMELGNAPSVVNDAVIPNSTPQSVAEYLSMLAYIYKTITGVSTWKLAAVPARHVIGAGLGGNTVAASSTIYCGPGSQETLATNEAQRSIPMPYAGIVLNFRIYLASAQPASGALTIILRKNGVNTAGAITIPISAAAGVYSTTCNISYAAGDLLSWIFFNAATAASGQLAGLSAEYDQSG